MLNSPAEVWYFYYRMSSSGKEETEDEPSMYFHVLLSRKAFMPMRIFPEELEVLQSQHVLMHAGKIGCFV